MELGVRFRADVAGYVTGLRFYKGPQNTGTHVGTLWTDDGQRLAQATFTNETATGWQQASFAAPVPVAPNTVYVASYHAPQGRYSQDAGYFAAAGVDRPPLRAPRDGESGPNGLYRYSPAPAFPTQTFEAANYWVDVVFEIPSGTPGPPAAPGGLSAAATTSGVTLSWTANSETGLAGYYVYRGASAGGPFTRLTSDPLPSPTFDDILAPAGASFYTVTAVRQTGQESAHSGPASATMAGANRIQNPGFELDANNDGRPDSWSGNANFVRSSLLPRSGSYGGRHSATNNANYTINQQVNGLTAGTTYTFAGAVRIPATSDTFTATLQVRWRNGNTAIRTDTVKAYSAQTSGWDKAVAELVAPAGTTNAQVLIVVNSLNATVLVDDFALR